MVTKEEYALLAAHVYKKTNDGFRAPIPTGWEVLDYIPNDVLGFSAGVYRRVGTNEIVIAYAGTDGVIDVPIDILLGLGVPNEQMTRAIFLYSDVIAAYPSATISFTGHSLGGGIASVMATYFDLPAMVFDPAPFAVSALSPLTLTPMYLAYSAYQLDHGRFVDGKFSTYLTQFPLIATTRQENVTSWSLVGEVLQPYRFGAIIGAGKDYRIDVAPSALSGSQLHSIVLLAATMNSTQLEQALQKLPGAVDLLVSNALYAGTLTKANFLTELLRNHVGVAGSSNPSGNGALDKFAADLLKLAGTPAAGLAQTNTAVRDGLIVAAMEYYYFKDPLQATSLFTVSGGGIHFKYSDIGASAYKSLPRLQAAITATLSAAEQPFAAQLLSKDAWHIQSGVAGLNWNAGAASDNDAAVGGDGADSLSAGAGNDILIGGASADTLNGGTGTDTLLGGSGSDTYLFNGNFGFDTIIDADGGTLSFDDPGALVVGNRLSENVWESVNHAWHYTLSGTAGTPTARLLIERVLGHSDSVLIQGWTGQFGISLPATPITVNGVTLTGDLNPTLTGNNYVYDVLGNIVPNGAATGRNDNLFGSAGNDVISGGGGNDFIVALAGNDTLDGGSADDVLVGGDGADTIYGGLGNDLILGFGTYQPTSPVSTTSTLYQAPAGQYTFVQGWNWAIYGATASSSVQILAPVTGSQGSADQSNIIDGGSGDDTIYAGLSDDDVDGGVGNDVIYGMAGNDFINGGNDSDSLYGDGPSDPTALNYTPITQHGIDFINGGQGNDSIYGMGGGDILYGDEGDDKLYGDGSTNAEIPVAINGDDFLDGGIGDDQLIGGGGNDILYGGDGVDKLFGDDTDYTRVPLASHGSDFLYGGAGNDQLMGGGGNDYLFGEDGDDLLIGDVSPVGTPGDVAGRDFLSGGIGIDTLIGGGGDDELHGGDGNDDLRGDDSQPGLLASAQGADTLYGEAGDDRLEGGGGADFLFGGDGADTILGDSAIALTPGAAQGADFIDAGDGNDHVWGMGGADTIYGGAGDDTIDGDDDAIPGSFHGNDTIYGGAGIDTISGNGGEDTIYGEDGNDFLQGDSIASGALEGNDKLYGGTGDDTLLGLGGNDLLSGGEGADTLQGSEGNDQLFGDEGDDFLFGGAGNDALVGGAGLDVLNGDEGNDTYLFGLGDGFDIITNNDVTVGRTDILQFKAGIAPSDVRLTRHFDYLVVTINGTTDHLLILNHFAQENGGKDSIDAIRFSDNTTWDAAAIKIAVQQPSSGADEIYAYSTGNTLHGLDGNDLVYGASGDDQLYGDAGDDQIEGRGGNDVIDGGDGNDMLNGSGTLFGGAGNDILSGGPTLIGGTGDDAYEVGAGAVIIENANEGIDTVTAFEDYALPDNVENLSLSDILLNPLNINGTGNAADNVIIGNRGNNILTGGDGNDTLDTGIDGIDTLIGGVGNDIYVVNHGISVTLIESANAGTDTVQASVTFALGVNFENLTLTGSDAIDGSGNSADNVLVGNINDNVLSGGGGNDTLNAGSAGADALIGGTGDDTYVINHAGVTVTESANEGMDLVQSSVSVTLGANIENLTLTGTGVASGTGNSADNIIIGNSANNTLTGGDGNDTLYGGTAGADVLVGGLGNDTYTVDRATGITITEAVAAGTDQVNASATHTLAANVENLTLTGTGAINGTGNTANNVIIGNSAANTLNAGTAGTDSLIGGAGNDTYVVDHSGVTATENVNEGVDLVQSSVTFTLGANVENLTLTGTLAIDGTGNTLANTMIGNSGINVLDGGAGADSMSGGAGNDTYVVDDVGDIVTEGAGAGTDLVQSAVSYTMGTNIENLTLTGALAINATGNTLVNALIGNSADNILDGGAGADSMSGGAGNDTYIVDNTGDVVTENAAAGTDLVQSSVTHTLATNVENLTLTGTAAINGTGNTLVNVITGNSAANTLDGGIGADTLIGGAGNDIYTVDNTSDVVTENAAEGTDLVNASATYTLGNDLENLTLTGTAVIDGAGNALDNVVTGNSGNNVLTGLAGNDTLDGGSAGTDTLLGGLGNDTYFINRATGVTVTENASEGTDSVLASVSYTLTANVENLTLSGTTAINGTGNTLDNVLTGNSGNNTITGLAGNDTLDGGSAGTDALLGGLGNDTYLVNRATGITITENASEGTDTVLASVTYTLGTNLENLTLTGSTAINGTGNTLVNVINGNSADNVLDGGTGADSLVGGAGNDTYVIDNTADVVTESANEGTDLVNASATYTLSANVENLTLTGTTAINGTGNTGDNVLTGNSGNNTLTGLAGNDTLDAGSAGTDALVGGLGNDTYIVGRATGITLTENASEGTDTVQASVTFTLATNFENLALTGSTAINGTGNTADNVLTGNSGNNTLTGLAGNDTLDAGSAGTDVLLGGVGNDTYIVGRATGITITENLNEGTDTVQASVAYTLGTNLENLTLTGSTAINGTGNTLNNVLLGNSGVNTLSGLAGNDDLTGGLGNDAVSGGDGADRYFYAAGDGADTIDNSSTDAALDRLMFTNLLRTQLTFTRSVNDLVITRVGVATDTVRVTNWFTVTNNQIDFVETSGGTVTTAAEINALIAGGGSGFPNAIAPPGGEFLAASVPIADAIDLLFAPAGRKLTAVHRIPIKLSAASIESMLEGSVDSEPLPVSQGTLIGGGRSLDRHIMPIRSRPERSVDAPLAASWALTHTLTAQYLGASDAAASLGGDGADPYSLLGSLNNMALTPALGALGSGMDASSPTMRQTSISVQDASPRLA